MTRMVSFPASQQQAPLWKHRFIESFGFNLGFLRKKEGACLKKADAAFRNFSITYLARSHNLRATEMSFPIAHKFMLQTNRPATTATVHRPCHCNEIYFRWGCIIPGMSRNFRKPCYKAISAKVKLITINYSMSRNDHEASNFLMVFVVRPVFQSLWISSDSQSMWRIHSKGFISSSLIKTSIVVSDLKLQFHSV